VAGGAHELGVIQEWTTYRAYQSAHRSREHPVLNEICRRIMKQELRHFAFYKEQAAEALAQSSVARKITSSALKIAWTPVGDGIRRRRG